MGVGGMRCVGGGLCHSPAVASQGGDVCQEGPCWVVQGSLGQGLPGVGAKGWAAPSACRL